MKFHAVYGDRHEKGEGTARGRATSRRAPIAPAWSMWLRITPPNIVPWGLVSRGIITT